MEFFITVKTKFPYPIYDPLILRRTHQLFIHLYISKGRPQYNPTKTLYFSDSVPVTHFQYFVNEGPTTLLNQDLPTFLSLCSLYIVSHNQLLLVSIKSYSHIKIYYISSGLSQCLRQRGKHSYYDSGHSSCTLSNHFQVLVQYLIGKDNKI